MNELKNDTNLREAVCRKEQKQPPMPTGLNERVMRSLTLRPLLLEREQKRRWLPRTIAAAVAVAASIALLVIFNFGKNTAKEQPLVARKAIEQPVAQPVVEVVYPEVVADEQPEEKTVTEPSEDAPQTTEPTSTENVKAPRHFNAQPILDITSSEDEPFFLASTSYMVTHRSYRDGLADRNTPDDSNDGGLNLYSAKDKGAMPQGWTDVKNWSNGQKVHRKLTKKERRQVAVAGAIAAKRWHIDIMSMTSMRYGSRTVTPDFYLELRGDTLRSYLPYLGQAYQSPTMSPAIGLNFEEPVLTYKESKPKSNKYTQIDIDAKTREDSYHYVIEIYDSSEATIRVRSLNRDPISFDGTMEFE